MADISEKEIVLRLMDMSTRLASTVLKENLPDEPKESIRSSVDRRMKIQNYFYRGLNAHFLNYIDPHPIELKEIRNEIVPP